MLYAFLLIAIGRALYALYVQYGDRADVRRWDERPPPDEEVPHTLPRRPLIVDEYGGGGPNA